MLKEKTIQVCYLTVGHTSVGIGIVGIFLPLVPTVPFLILTAFCYERGSPKLYQKLLDNRYLGPPIIQWKEKRSVSPRVKILFSALGTLGFVSIFFVIQRYYNFEFWPF